jgi:hypothetical protein
MITDVGCRMSDLGIADLEISDLETDNRVWLMYSF